MEARQIVQEVRAGNLESACKALDQEWAASGVSYIRSQKVMANHMIRTLHRASYNSMRFADS